MSNDFNFLLILDILNLKDIFNDFNFLLVLDLLTLAFMRQFLT